MKKNKKAVVLLSGGLDSATTLFLARRSGFDPHCLVFDFGQRHSKEIKCAKRIAEKIRAPYRIMKISLPWKGSSLLDKGIALRETGAIAGIPNTYVPARNTIFIAFAVSWAEVISAGAVFIGANAVDFSGYPDCTPKYFKKYQGLIDTGIKRKGIKIKTPLLRKTKGEIIKTGISLGVPYNMTWSCYKGGKRPCGKCDSCRFRQKGFKEAGVKDPLI